MCISTNNLGNSRQLHTTSQRAGCRTRFHESISVKSFTSRGREIALAILSLALFVNKIEEWLVSKEEQRLKITPSLVFALAIIFAVKIKVVRTWMNKVSKTTTSALSSVTSLETLSRIRCSVNRSMNSSSMRLFTLASKCSPFHANDRKHCLSAGDSFLSHDDTGKLLLSDIKEIFQFGAMLNRAKGEKGPPGRRLCVQKALDSVEAAIAFSRGPNTRTPLLKGDRGTLAFGDMDALAFIAACRIFAEWRSIRLVPDGYPRYAMGMGVARRDLLQNLGKVEKAIHDYMEKNADPGSVGMTPTLRQLMQYETNRNMHPNLPRLTDRSGANGLLWTIRQIKYQTLIFSNLRQTPFLFPDSKSANHAAYHATYDKYHGFFTRQIFQATFDVAPRGDVIMEHMNLKAPEDLYCVENLTQAESMEAESLNESGNEQEETWIHLDLEVTERQPNKDYGLEPHRFVDIQVRPKPQHPLERFGNHIQVEWNRMISQCAGVTEQPPGLNNSLHQHVICDQPLRRQASFKLADMQFCSFIDFMQPLLNDLQNMMEELNMNDPSRV